MKQKLFMMLAALMLMGTSAMAQSETLKGDVNGDGVVDVADIAAVIKIMADEADIEPGYYWYIGQENPTEMTSISSVVTDNSSPGWRYIGDTKPTSSTFTATNMLWKGEENGIDFESRNYAYIAIPYQPLQMWDSMGSDGLVFNTKLNNGNPIKINGVDYYCYQSDAKMSAFAMNIYNKGVAEQPVYYWYVGQEAVTADNYTTLEGIQQVESYPSKYEYTPSKRARLYIVIAESKTVTKIEDAVSFATATFSEDTTVSIPGYKVYKSGGAVSGKVNIYIN